MGGVTVALTTICVNNKLPMTAGRIIFAKIKDNNCEH